MKRALTAMSVALLAGTAATAQEVSSIRAQNEAIDRRPEAGTIAYARQSDGPGPARYGAEDEAGRTALVRVDGLFAFEPPIVVEISPWYRVQGFQGDRPISHGGGLGHVENGGDGYYSNAYSRGLRAMAGRIERARLQWLEDNGYVKAVRTFGSARERADEQTSLPEPRGVIRVPESIKNQKTRFQVDAGDGGSSVVTFGRLTRVGVATVVPSNRSETGPESEEVADATG